MFMAVV